MKKLLPLILALLSLTAHAQDAVNLDTAIQEIAVYLDARLEAKTVVAILNIKSAQPELSSYIISRLTDNIVKMNNLIPVDRENIDVLRKELNFQLSGDVSDETSQSIGKMLGAQTVISGQILPAQNMYYLEVKATDVETTRILGSTSRNIILDKQLKTLTGDTAHFPISIGAGVHVGGTFCEGKYGERGRETVLVNGNYYNSNYTVSEINSRSELDIGAFVFFDLKYAEINAGWHNGYGKSKWSWNRDYYFNNSNIKKENQNSTGSFSLSAFNVGILAKYPFYLNKITLFPAIGAEYQLWLFAKENKTKVRGDLSANNSVWLKAGGGMDYAITSSLFIRGELLWGFKLDSKNETRDKFSHFTHAPAVNVGLGYVFGRNP